MSNDLTGETKLKLPLREWVWIVLAVGGWLWGGINQNQISAYVSKTDFDLTKQSIDNEITDVKVNYWAIQRKLENMEKIQEERHTELMRTILNERKD